MYLERQKNYWYMSYFRHEHGIRQDIKRFVHAMRGCCLNFNLQMDGDINVNEVDYMFLLTNEIRLDYKNLFDKVYNACDRNKIYIKVFQKNSPNFRFVKNIFRHSSIYKKCNYVITGYYEKDDYRERSEKLNFLQSLSMYLYVIRGKTIADIIWDETGKKVYNLVVMHDYWPYEPMIIEKAKKENVNTICLQHAIMITDFSYNNMDTQNLINLICDYYLLWGDETLQTMKLHNKREIVYRICGNPTVDQKTLCNGDKDIGIVMDVQHHHVYNQKLIDLGSSLAEKLNCKAVIRMHPSDKKENYDFDMAKVIFDNNLDNTVAILGHTSTMIFTYLVFGKRVLRYKSDYIFFKYDSNLEFEDAQELQNCFNYAISHSSDYYKHLGENYIGYIGEESELAYKKNLDNIMTAR